jgi:hypothetical protein
MFLPFQSTAELFPLLPLAVPKAQNRFSSRPETYLRKNCCEGLEFQDHSHHARKRGKRQRVGVRMTAKRVKETDRLKVVSLRLTKAQQERLATIGGVKWLRDFLDKKIPVE